MGNILISGVDVPKNCHDCKNGWCNLWEQNKNMTKDRHSSCPITVLQPHEDLIDRDRATTQIIAEICQFCKRALRGDYCEDCLVQRCLDAVGRVSVVIKASIESESSTEGKEGK